MATRVLVVDDEPTVCESVRQMLGQTGCSVESAVNASEALAKLQAQSFDLVLTDFLMRGLNGRQLAWVIKSRYPQMPIILITGCCFPSDSVEEIDCILLKPFSRRQLWTAMGEVFMRVLTKEESPSVPSMPTPDVQVPQLLTRLPSLPTTD